LCFGVYGCVQKCRNTQQLGRQSIARKDSIVTSLDLLYRTAMPRLISEPTHKQLQGRAITIANRAVKAGTLVRAEKCSQCGASGNIEGHHPDYTKPLEVIWLCKNCHSHVHAQTFPNSKRQRSREEAAKVARIRSEIEREQYEELREKMRALGKSRSAKKRAAVQNNIKAAHEAKYGRPYGYKRKQ
jgi:hypothetical protein